MSKRVSQENYGIAAVQHGLGSGKRPGVPKLKFAALQAGKKFEASGREFLEAGVQAELPEYARLHAEPRHAVSGGAKGRGHSRLCAGSRRKTDDTRPRQRAERRDARSRRNQPPARAIRLQGR